MKRLLPLLCILGSGELPAAPLAPDQVVRVCAQSAEWPPFMYTERAGNHKLVGYTIDFLQRGLAERGVRYTIDLLPWKRCMELVQRGLYDMMTDASNSPERAQNFLVSKPYYTQQLVYFYDKERPRPAIHTAADMSKFRLCGMAGYNYSGFGLKPEEVETGSQSLAQSFQKLKHDRCDAIPERLEVTLGYQAMGVVDLEKLSIGTGHLPDLPRSTFHMMVSRSVVYGPELLEILDEGIDKLNNNGGAQELAAKYGIQGVETVRAKPRPR